MPRLKQKKKSKRTLIRFIIPLCLTIFVLLIGSLFYRHASDKTDYPVDLVFLWVDSNDEVWAAKKRFWQEQYGSLPENAIDTSRFRQFDELKYALRSVEKNLPWIRNIFIVTDNQTPAWLNTNNPKIKIINHTQIFPKEALPVFNSNAIEARLPYIPGLAEHFLYANDDCYVRVPLEKSFFFDEKENPRLFVRFKKQTYDSNLWLAQIKQAHEMVASKYPLHFVITPSHNMQAYRKSYFLEAIKEFPEQFKQTTFSKFRQATDVQRVLVDLSDRMKNRNTMISENNTSALPLNCQWPFLLVSQNFWDLQNMLPCLMCLNDFEGKTDDEIDLTLKILNQLWPHKSEFEK